MKRILLFLITLPFALIGQEVKFEKFEININRDIKAQTKLVKIEQKDAKFNSNVKVTITKAGGNKIEINPESIEHEFKKDDKKWFIFPIFFNEIDTSIKDKSIEFIKLTYTKGAGASTQNMEETLVINILKFEAPKDETPDDFPNSILFAGTNIDPIGENVITSGSFNFESNFQFDDSKWGIQFGAFTNKNQTKDSTSLQTHQYATDIATRKGLIRDTSFIFTQLYARNVSTKTRSSGGYMHLTRYLTGGKKTTLYGILGAELVFRKFTSTSDPRTIRKDSTLYKGSLLPLGTTPITKDNIYIPSRGLNQLYIDLGIRIVNNSEKVYLVLQPMLSLDTFIETYSRPNNTLNNKGRFYTLNFRGFIAYKPVNVTAMIDLKVSAINNNFFNFSVGIPIDVKSVFTKSKT